MYRIRHLVPQSSSSKIAPCILGNCTTMHTINTLSYSPRHICILNTIAIQHKLQQSTTTDINLVKRMIERGSDMTVYGKYQNINDTQKNTRARWNESCFHQHHQPPHDKYTVKMMREERDGEYTYQHHPSSVPMPMVFLSHYELSPQQVRW